MALLGKGPTGKPQDLSYTSRICLRSERREATPSRHPLTSSCVWCHTLTGKINKHNAIQSIGGGGGGSLRDLGKAAVPQVLPASVLILLVSFVTGLCFQAAGVALSPGTWRRRP